jgi:N-acetylglucosaminyldiphosphoundecaprenol N-acetyl-beta-D-mannosaminyltransferase
VSSPKAISILGVRVDSLPARNLIEVLDGFVAGGWPRHVVTVNPEFLVQARRAPVFRDVLNSADLALADGVGLVWAARLLGFGSLVRNPGVEAVEGLAALCASKGYRMFLLGAGPGVAEETGRVLAARHPGFHAAGCYGGSPSPAEQQAIIDVVRAARPHILLVAYGAPHQDLWIRQNLDVLGVPLCIGVGGTFDYLSGRVPRAPGWMRRAGLEWLFRLARQPWRWRRMLRLPVFVLLVLHERLRGPGDPAPTTVAAPDARRGEVSSPGGVGRG